MSNPNKTIKLPGVVLSYPALFRPKKYDETSDPAYNVYCLFDAGSPAHRVLVATIKELVAECWPKGKPNGLTTPLKEGDERIAKARNPESYAAYEGKLYVNARNKSAVPIVGPDGVTPLTEETGRDLVYGGAIANVVLNLYAWDHRKHGPQVNSTLKAVQITGKGQRIGSGGGVDPTQYFEAVEATAGDDDDWL